MAKTHTLYMDMKSKCQRCKREPAVSVVEGKPGVIGLRCYVKAIKSGELDDLMKKKRDGDARA